jgi:hypothetical protein
VLRCPVISLPHCSQLSPRENEMLSQAPNQQNNPNAVQATAHKAHRSSVDQYLSKIREAMENRSYEGLAVDVDPELEDLSIFDEPGIDLSVPAPGSGDTFSNAAPHEVAPGQLVFYATPEGEKAAIVVQVATADFILTDPDPEAYPPPEKGVGRGLYGGGGFFIDPESQKLPPVRVRAKLTDPTVIIKRLDNGKQLGKKVIDLGTIRRSTSTTSVGSAGMTLQVLQQAQDKMSEGGNQPGPSPSLSSSP